MIWLVDWLTWLVYLSFDLNIYSCNELERLLSECECFVLLSSQQFFSHFKVDLMLHNAPNIFSSPLPSMTFSLSFFLLLLLPTACIYTFTKHNFAKCICCFFSFFCMLLKCHYNWGEHAEKLHNMENIQMREKMVSFWMCF